RSRRRSPTPATGQSTSSRPTTTSSTCGPRSHCVPPMRTQTSSCAPCTNQPSARGSPKSSPSPSCRWTTCCAGRSTSTSGAGSGDGGLLRSAAHTATHLPRSDREVARLEQLVDAVEEAVRDDPVDHAVVVREGHEHDRVDRHRVRPLVLDDDDALLDLAHPEDAHVRLRDDRAAHEVALPAGAAGG